MTKRIQDYLAYPTGSFQHAQVFVTSLFCAIMARGPATSELDFWAAALHARPAAMTAIGIGGSVFVAGAIDDMTNFVLGMVNARPSGDVAYINSTDPAVRAVAGGHMISRVHGGGTWPSIDFGPFTVPTNFGDNFRILMTDAVTAALARPDHNRQFLNHVSFALLKHEAGSYSTPAQQSTITGDDATLAYAIANFL